MVKGLYTVHDVQGAIKTACAKPSLDFHGSLRQQEELVQDVGRETSRSTRSPKKVLTRSRLVGLRACFMNLGKYNLPWTGLTSFPVRVAISMSRVARERSSLRRKTSKRFCILEEVLNLSCLHVSPTWRVRGTY